jgi:hypothetical protein
MMKIQLLAALVCTCMNGVQHPPITVPPGSNFTLNISNNAQQTIISSTHQSTDLPSCLGSITSNLASSSSWAHFRSWRWPVIGLGVLVLSYGSLYIGMRLIAKSLGNPEHWWNWKIPITLDVLQQVPVMELHKELMYDMGVYYRRANITVFSQLFMQFIVDIKKEMNLLDYYHRFYSCITLLKKIMPGYHTAYTQLEQKKKRLEFLQNYTVKLVASLEQKSVDTSIG